jgi:Glycosyl hydrolase family 26
MHGWGRPRGNPAAVAELVTMNRTLPRGAVCTVAVILVGLVSLGPVSAQQVGADSLLQVGTHLPGTSLAAKPIALGISGADTSSDPVGLNAYKSVVGRAPAADMIFQNWSEPLYYGSQMNALEGTGITPIITWDPQLSTGAGIPLSQIVAGDYNAYIIASAKLAAAAKGTLMIRFAHEMNLPSSSFGPSINGNTPAEFIAAWRHVVELFRENGATNVQWIWSPNVYCNGQCPFAQFYPGDAYVDWVALDGYNYGPSLGVPWTSLLSVFQGSYQVITALTSKPLMIAETASAEAGGNKAAWIIQAFLTDIPSSLPRVRAVVWFNRVKSTDWRVNSSVASLAAWKTVVASPLYSGNFGTGPDLRARQHGSGS